MTIRTMRDLLAGHPVFERFDPATLDELAGCGRTEHFARGTPILREGEEARKVLILREGDVAVEISAPGRAPMIVETLHAGDLLGWGWLIPPYRTMADARALTDVRAVSLDAACVRAKCDLDPAIGYELFKAWLPHLAHRMRMQRLCLLDLYGGDAA